MAKTDRDWAKHYAQILRRWSVGDEPSEAQAAFFSLTLLDVPPRDEAWGVLRDALAANANLKHPSVQHYLTAPDLAREEGYWWYDPATWTVEPAPAS